MSLYDSWYLRAVHPVEPVGIWIRHTFHEGPQGVRGAHWFTLFTPDGVEARKASFDRKPAVSADRFVGTAGDARWNLRVDSEAAEFAHLPYRWMYRAPFPRTKPISVAPLGRMHGEVAIGGRIVPVDAWPGMVGHNWGAEHAHRWIWLHAAELDGEPGSWLDLTLARLKLGRWVSPWLANGAISLAGERHRVGGLFRRPEVEETPERARIALAGPGLRLRLSVRSRPDAMVVWPYADPAGGQHFAANCSIAALSATIVRDGRETVYRTSHKAAYELGMTEPPAGHRVQPYPDP